MSQQKKTDDFLYTAGEAAFHFRRITPEDNPAIADVIRSAFVEFDAPRHHSVYDDPETDVLSEVFMTEGSGYWVVEWQGKICAGCGFYPTDGLPEGMVEIVKFYALPEVRGKGVGTALFRFVEQQAKQAGYTRSYLESIPAFGNAVSLYRKQGYKALPEAIGHSGHTAMTVFMEKVL